MKNNDVTINYWPCKDEQRLDRYLDKNNIPFNIADKSNYTQIPLLDTLQPVDIQHHGYSPTSFTRELYVFTRGSTELNISMMLFLLENEQIVPDVQDRIIKLLIEFKTIATLHKKSLFDMQYVVYHGTSQLVHKTNTFVTTAFLSTTRLLHVAADYGNVIYAIYVPPFFPVMNFHDNLGQILLPIGTYISIDKVVPDALKFHNDLYCSFVQCHIDASKQKELPSLIDQYIDIFKHPCAVDNSITCNFFNLKQSRSRSQSQSLIETNLTNQTLQPIKLQGSSSFYSATIKNASYIVKDICKPSKGIRVLSNDTQVFKRILNEVLAAHIYKRVYGLLTFDYKILDKRQNNVNISTAANFLIVSKTLDVKYRSTKGRVLVAYTGFLVDCILGNWDVYNNNNIGFINDNEDDDDIAIRTDVGGALAFRGRGDEKQSFATGTIPNEHFQIAQYSFPRLEIPFEERNSAIDYLVSIKRSHVRTRLAQVKAVFVKLVDTINEEQQSQKMHKLLDTIIEAVLFRDAWYRKHAKSAINSIKSFFHHDVHVGGAVVAAAATLKKNKKAKATINDANFENAPTSFVASPGNFMRMIKNHSTCKL